MDSVELEQILKKMMADQIPSQRRRLDEFSALKTIFQSKVLDAPNIELGSDKFRMSRIEERSLPSIWRGGFAKFEPSQFDQRSVFEKLGADLPDIPKSWSNAIQGFGSGASFEIADSINGKLGLAAYVERDSSEYQQAKVVGNFIAVTFYFPAALRVCPERSYRVA